MKRIKYRPEIDGLRAISVISVILYHLDIIAFKGGFVGVDIFFTISGFLITSLILLEKQNNEFSYSNFLNRRIRRIFPILVVVLFISLIIAISFSLPTDLLNINYSALFSLIFTSNFYFSIVGNVYGGESSIFTPLLHTWSLSIEEQFYVFFPLFFIFIKKDKIFYILIFLIFLSLVISLNLEKNYQHHNFYFTPSRIWEILLGCCVAIIKFKNDNSSRLLILNNLLCLLGIILILFSILTFSIESFSTLKNLIPTLGTCLLLYFGYKNNIIINLLSKDFFVKIGLMSYSLYLWHYPIISFFTKYNLFNDNFTFKIIFFLIVLFLTSYFFYTFVEKKFRNTNIISNLKFYLILVPVLIIFLSTSLSIHLSDGFKKKFLIQDYNIDNDFHYYVWLKSTKEIPKFTDSKKKKTLIIGNSHGHDTYNSFSLNDNLFNNYEFSFYWIQVHEFKKFLTNSLPANFKPYTKYSLKKLKSLYDNADIIIISSSWDPKEDVLSLDELSKILNESNKKIILSTHTPKFPQKNYKYFRRLSVADEWILTNKRIPNGKNLSELKKLFYLNKIDKTELNNKITLVAKKYNFDLLNKEDILCNNDLNECEFLTPNNSKIQWDGSHYTIEGAKYFGKIIFNHNLFD